MKFRFDFFAEQASLGYILLCKLAMNWRIRRKKFPGIKDRDITTDMSWSMFVSGFMLFFWGERGGPLLWRGGNCFWGWSPPPPSSFQAFLEINWTKGERKKASGPQALALVFYSKLTRNDFAVCTKVNAYNLWFSARHVKPIKTVFLYAEREDLD